MPSSTSGTSASGNQERKDPNSHGSLKTYTHRYSYRDIILYHLGLGSSLKDPGAEQLLYEGANLQVLPTYGIIAAHPAIYTVPLRDYLPNMNPAKALHGEQYMELLAPLPTKGVLVTKWVPSGKGCSATAGDAGSGNIVVHSESIFSELAPEVLEISDKGPGKGTVVVVRMMTSDQTTGQALALNEFVIFVMGAGGCNFKAPNVSRPAAATASNAPPQQPPDASLEVATTSDQAALYRLSGDYNPLHIDPKVAASAGFPSPILHGLCTLGMSVKAILAHVGALPGSSEAGLALKSVKARFAKHVFPGETLVVHMWREASRRVVFTTEVKNRPGTLAITSAAIELQPELPHGKAGSKL